MSLPCSILIRTLGNQSDYTGGAQLTLPHLGIAWRLIPKDLPPQTSRVRADCRAPNSVLGAGRVSVINGRARGSAQCPLSQKWSRRPVRVSAASSMAAMTFPTET